MVKAYWPITDHLGENFNFGDACSWSVFGDSLNVFDDDVADGDVLMRSRRNVSGTGFNRSHSSPERGRGN